LCPIATTTTWVTCSFLSCAAGCSQRIVQAWFVVAKILDRGRGDGEGGGGTGNSVCTRVSVCAAFSVCMLCAACAAIGTASNLRWERIRMLEPRRDLNWTELKLA
jgi:hypothetical protein